MAIDLKVASEPASKKLPISNFDLNSFERFALLSKKTRSTLLLTNLQKTEKCSFQTLRTWFLSSR